MLSLINAHRETAFSLGNLLGQQVCVDKQVVVKVPVALLRVLLPPWQAGEAFQGFQVNSSLERLRGYGAVAAGLVEVRLAHLQRTFVQARGLLAFRLLLFHGASARHFFYSGRVYPRPTHRTGQRTLSSMHFTELLTYRILFNGKNNGVCESLSLAVRVERAQEVLLLLLNGAPVFIWVSTDHVIQRQALLPGLLLLKASLLVARREDRRGEKLDLGVFLPDAAVGSEPQPVILELSLLGGRAQLRPPGEVPGVVQRAFLSVLR